MRLDNVRLRQPLAGVMRDKGMTVSALHTAVNAGGGRQWSRAMIGHFRRYTDWTVNPELAARIAVALGTPYGDLFEARQVAA